MPLMVDGLMTSGDRMPADDLRSHSGVTCRLCHGVKSRPDGNGSYVWARAPIDAPELGDPASIARHKQQVTTKLDAGLCVAVTAAFCRPTWACRSTCPASTSPACGAAPRTPATAWRASTRSSRRRASIATWSASRRRTTSSARSTGRSRSHRFLGGHTWMASMRGDNEQLRSCTAKLDGAASIDVAGARVARCAAGDWHLPADGAPVAPGTPLELDVVIRNLLVGHRFPGGVLDVRTPGSRSRSRIAAATGSRRRGCATRRIPTTTTRTCCARSSSTTTARARRARDAAVPHADRDADARAARRAGRALRVRRAGEAVAAAAAHGDRAAAPPQPHAHDAGGGVRGGEDRRGRAFIAGARGARDVELDACKPQPITLVAETRVELGRARRHSTRGPRGSACTSTAWRWSRRSSERLGRGARRARGRARRGARRARAAMVTSSSAGSRRSRAAPTMRSRSSPTRARCAGPGRRCSTRSLADALRARVALARGDRAGEGAAPSAHRQNTRRLVVYARVLGSRRRQRGGARGRDEGPRARPARSGSAAHRRRPRCSRSGSARAGAQTAYTRFRAPDDAAGCASLRESVGRCMRERNAVPTIATCTEARLDARGRGRRSR